MLNAQCSMLNVDAQCSMFMLNVQNWCVEHWAFRIEPWALM
jgi:hypothetical protein